MKKVLLFALIVLFLFIHAWEGHACTTFCIKDADNLVFGRNFDFQTGYGLVVINKRNQRKTAMIRPPEIPLEWVSRYGSITFNQAGCEFPYGGINEKGLVIEQMWLEHTGYPEMDDRSGLTELQWIQYQLDNSSSVEEVLASDTLIRVSKLSVAPLHFLVCDREGHVAAIEYIDGKMVYHTGSTLPVCVLANNNYEESLQYMKSKLNTGGEETVSFTAGSLDRFSHVESMIKNYKDQDVIDYSFNILQAVSQGEHTRWSIVYDINNMKVYFKTSTNARRRSFAVADFDFSCDAPVMIADIDSNMVDDKLNFEPYSYKANRELIDNVFNSVEFLRPLPEEVREASARYPESVICGN